MGLYPLAGFLCNAINPLLILLVVAQRGGPIRAWPFWLRWGVALVVAVSLAELGKKFQVWPGHSGFPSGHTTFAATCSTALVLQRGVRWILPGLVLTGLMMASLVIAGWHSIPDTLGAVAFSLTIMTLVWRIFRNFQPFEEKSRLLEESDDAGDASHSPNAEG